MRRGINGFCGLMILTSCFILGCLCYVEICRDLSTRIGDPEQRQYWQLRAWAIRWSDPIQQARDSFDNGEYRLYEVPDAESFVIAGRRTHPGFEWLTNSMMQQNLVEGTMRFAFDRRCLVPSEDSLDIDREYSNATRRFAEAFNREMIRLININGARN